MITCIDYTLQVEGVLQGLGERHAMMLVEPHESVVSPCHAAGG